MRRWVLAVVVAGCAGQDAATQPNDKADQAAFTEIEALRLQLQGIRATNDELSERLEAIEKVVKPFDIDTPYQIGRRGEVLAVVAPGDERCENGLADVQIGIRDARPPAVDVCGVAHAEHTWECVPATLRRNTDTEEWRVTSGCQREGGPYTFYVVVR